MHAGFPQFEDLGSSKIMNTLGFPCGGGLTLLIQVCLESQNSIETLDAS